MAPLGPIDFPPAPVTPPGPAVIGEHLPLATASAGRRAAVSLVLAMAAAAAFRMSFAEQVFRPTGLELTGDDDPAYHVLRAERMARGAPGAPWFDPALNYPHGAEIPWPPLFDALIVGGARLLSPAQVPPRSTFVLVAALLPVLLAVITVPIVRSLASALLGGTGLVAAWVFALMPAHAMLSRAGRADQHVLELLVSSAIFLAAGRSMDRPEGPRRGSVLLLAAAFVAAFWSWGGSSLYLLVLVAFAGGWFVLAGAGDRRARRLVDDLRDGAAVGAVVLAASVAALRGTGPLLALALSGVSGFPVVQLLLVAAFALGLSLAARSSRASASVARRAAVAALAAAVPLGLLATSGAFRASVGHGLAGLVHASAWYQNIEEFDPIMFAGFDPWQSELLSVVAMYGIAVFVTPFAAWAIVRRLGAERDRRAPLAFALFWGLTMLVLAVARKRFALYLSAPLALWTGALVETWGVRIAATLRRPWAPIPAAAAIAAVLLAPAAAGLDRTFAPEFPAHAALRALLARLPAAAIGPDRPAVLADWASGHLVQYASGRPTVSSPFGIEGGEGAMEDEAAFFLERDPARASGLLSRRGVGVVVLGDPTGEVYFAQAFVPGAPEAVTVTRSIRGYRARLNPVLRELVVSRLWYGDGGAAPGLPALDGFRLVDEITPALMRPKPYKAFAVVPGARLRVATSAPGSIVRVVVNLRTGEGRELAWSAFAVASGRCEAVVGVPYATGMNGHVLAAPALVLEGERTEQVAVSEESVLTGAEVPVAIGNGCERGGVRRAVRWHQGENAGRMPHR